MVQRLTYRKRHSYATKSNQTRVVKTPGEICVLHGFHLADSQPAIRPPVSSVR